MADGTPATVDITFHGGFINDEEGVWNSEAPSDDDVKIGNQIVAFYTWTDDMGGEVAGNALHAAHGGLYRTVAGPDEVFVLGRGEGYAIDRNIRMSNLRAAVRNIEKDQESK